MSTASLLRTFYLVHHPRHLVVPVLPQSLDHAKLVPDWDAVMKGRSGVGTPPPMKDFSPKRHKKN